LKKNGGNVTSYFLTPDARVIHAVTGPVNARRLLAEAQWARQTFLTAGGGLASPKAQKLQLASAHRQALARSGGGQKRKIHQLLADRPLVQVKQVANQIFTEILGETLRTDDANLDLQGVELARRGGLPMLFVLHDSKAEDNQTVMGVWKQLAKQHDETLAKLSKSFVVIPLPLNELPSLSRYLNMPPFERPKDRTAAKKSPLLVVTRSTGQQVDALTSWGRPARLAEAMASGLIAEIETRKLGATELNSLLQLVEPIDSETAQKVRNLITQARNRERRGGSGLVAMSSPEGPQ